MSTPNGQTFKSFGSEFSLPIEIKCDWNKDLWLGLHTQLIKRYSIEKNSHGYGIYVVLWFGEHNRGKMPVTPDGADKPENPKEIQHYLYDRMNPEEKVESRFGSLMFHGWTINRRYSTPPLQPLRLILQIAPMNNLCSARMHCLKFKLLHWQFSIFRLHHIANQKMLFLVHRLYSSPLA